jgi:Acyl-CoA dehydrogenase, C-terminal domain
MLDFITEEHRMVSASMAALCADLGRADRDSVLTREQRIEPARIRQGLKGLGLFEELTPDALAASSLVQVMIALESGKASLPYPVLESLSAAFFLAHAEISLSASLDPLQSLFTRPSLSAEETELPVVCERRLSGVAEAVPFTGLCQKLLLTVRHENNDSLALAVVDLSACRIRSRGSVEPDYPVGDVVFDDVELSEHAIIRTLRDGRNAVAALALHDAILATAEIAGASLRLIDMTREYLLTRTQFGKPLGANQILKHSLAKHHVRAQALVMLLNYAAAALDAAAPDAPAAVRAAKQFAGSSGTVLAQDMLQLHGAIGYTMEYPLHLFMRRVFRLAASHGSTYQQGEMLCRDYRLAEH